MTRSDELLPDEFLNKFRSIEKRLAERHGDFVLFALIMREDSGGKWDVVASAPWIQDTRAGLEAIIEEMSLQLTPEELVNRISRIAPIKLTHPLVQTLSQKLNVEHVWISAGNLIIDGHEFGRICVITAMKREQVGQAPRA